MPETYAPKFGIDGSVKVGTAGTSASSGTALAHISGPSITMSRETEDVDMTVTGMVKAYVAGKADVGVTFTMKNFQTSLGVYPADIAAIMAAFSGNTAISAYITDSALGDIDGDFIVSKMDETRENGKIISWSVELKPTYVGRVLSWT